MVLTCACRVCALVIMQVLVLASVQRCSALQTRQKPQLVRGALLVAPVLYVCGGATVPRLRCMHAAPWVLWALVLRACRMLSLDSQELLLAGREHAAVPQGKPAARPGCCPSGSLARRAVCASYLSRCVSYEGVVVLREPRRAAASEESRKVWVSSATLYASQCIRVGADRKGL